MQIVATGPRWTRPSVATAVEARERELKRQVEDLKSREDELSRQAGGHRDQMQALQSSGRTLLRRKNKAVPFAVGSFALMVTGLIGGAITQHPWLLGIGVAGMLGTMVSCAFLEASQDHIDDMGERFEKHQEATRQLDAERAQTELRREEARGDLEGHRQVVAMASPNGGSGIGERQDGVAVAGVVLKKSRRN
ncbi:MAG: hypothetical protein AB1758_21060 [Candidatus Eremiobacterota bacterium]